MASGPDLTTLEKLSNLPHPRFDNFAKVVKSTLREVFLRRGHYPIQAETLALASQILLLPLEEPIFEIVEVYLQHKLMPQNPLGDALHLAIASYHKCDFLLTWNCQNLANANKFAHIKRINNLLGLYLPTLITPLELLGETS
jgi:hypothetical protein